MGQKCNYASIGGKIISLPKPNEYVPIGSNGSSILGIHCPPMDHDESVVWKYDLKTRKFSSLGRFREMRKNGNGVILNVLDGDIFTKDIPCTLKIYKN